MSNASLKEQLQAVASQLSDKKKDKVPSHKAFERKTNAHPKNVKTDGKQKKPKPKWLEYAQYGVELLRVYFPNCFKHMNDMKPLKIGIKQDLVKWLSTKDTIVTEDKACMVKSLSYYVNTVAYHRTVVAGAVRIDLEGNPAGVVSTEEAQYSSERHQARLQAKQSTTSHQQLQTMDSGS